MKWIFFLLLMMSADVKAQTRTVLDTLGYDSVFQAFHSNGNLFYQIRYKNGKQNGWKEQWHANGQLWNREWMINGVPADGYYYSLHENGRVYEAYRIKNGRHHGKRVDYNEDGTPYRLYYYNRKGSFRKMKEWDKENKRWVRTNFY